ncbi:MAG: hypothetical protein JRJ84_22610 [Deltaproteobacteria bacterium]|nr:hypothetical protein [Deltaproteobacteria bacterium]
MTALRYALFAALVTLLTGCARHWIAPELLAMPESDSEVADQILDAVGDGRVNLTMRDHRQYRGISLAAGGDGTLLMRGDVRIDPADVGYLRSFVKCRGKKLKWDRLEVTGCEPRTWAAPDLLVAVAEKSETPNAVSVGLTSEIVAVVGEPRSVDLYGEPRAVDPYRDARSVDLVLRSGLPVSGNLVRWDTPWLDVRLQDRPKEVRVHVYDVERVKRDSAALTALTVTVGVVVVAGVVVLAGIGVSMDRDPPSCGYLGCWF